MAHQGHLSNDVIITNQLFLQQSQISTTLVLCAKKQDGGQSTGHVHEKRFFQQYTIYEM